ncbi:brassinosteroid-responsive RING protein 1-like [Mercurialis annua]|uniref:brassinosteroid-responsive RING protein 1-like n=1 Tax=Mercurialis annua TaxID=3986 RepID=UPI00215DFA23|nr:brassinosteroid-responsive RING protein 1-like [Mercurialis annua]
MMKMPSSFGNQFLEASVSYLKIVFSIVLTGVRLLKPPRQTYAAEEETASYILVMNRLCPTPVPVPIETITALIKKRLKVTKRSSEDEECVCLVCLDCINTAHEIRELCNCRHMFHRECLEKWIDEGRVTCPLCRSMLFPDNILSAAAAAAN